MDSTQQLHEARATLDAWRRANVTGRMLTPAQLDELRSLKRTTEQLAVEVARAKFAATQAPAVVLEIEADSVVCRLPRELLQEFLICHEAGLSDEQHMVIALDSGHLPMLKQIFELRRAASTNGPCGFPVGKPRLN